MTLQLSSFIVKKNHISLFLTPVIITMPKCFNNDLIEVIFQGFFYNKFLLHIVNAL